MRNQLLTVAILTAIILVWDWVDKTDPVRITRKWHTSNFDNEYTIELNLFFPVCLLFMIYFSVTG